MTTKTVEPATTTEAEAQAQQAEAEVTALQDRIRSGDTSVKPEELSRAKELAEYTRLQVDAARLCDDKRAREATKADVDETSRAALHLAATGPVEVERRKRAAIKAFCAYADAVDDLAHRTGLILPRIDAANGAAMYAGLDGTPMQGVRRQHSILEVHVDGETFTVSGDQPEPSQVVASIVSAAHYVVPDGAGLPFFARIDSQRPWPPKAAE